jgi:serine/threonine-protein kinase RsbW
MNNSSKNTLEIILKGRLEEINHLATALDLFCNEAGLDDLIKNQVNLILEELYTNTANYGFQGITNGQVSITLSVIDGQLDIIYQDNGIEFNPLEMEAPDLQLSIDDRPIGGLGVYFVKALTDQIEYSRVGEFNLLKMQKSLCSLC